MSGRETYEIIKRSADVTIPIVERPSNYNTTSNQLYLDMIENKEKVRPECIPVVDEESGPSLDAVQEIKALKRKNDDIVEQSPSKIMRGDLGDPHFNRLQELVGYNRDNEDSSDSDDSSEGGEDGQGDGRDNKCGDGGGDESDIVVETVINRDVNPSGSHGEIGNKMFINHPPSTKTLSEQYAAAKNQMIDEKRVMVAKYALLTKMYPKAEIPHVTMDTDLGFMTTKYESLIMSMRLDEKHQTYKKFLIAGFFLIEKVLGKFFKMDMAGFTETQIKSMDQYDRLLIELGHKHYIPDAPEKFPVEIRLVGVILIQTVIFVIMQKLSHNSNPMTGIATSLAGMFMGGGGDNLSGLMNLFMNNVKNDTKPQNTNGVSRMSGPNKQ